MPDFEKLAEKAIHEQWQGARLRRVLRIFKRFHQPIPVDLHLLIAANMTRRILTEVL